MSAQPNDHRGEGGDEEEVAPPRLALLLMVAFPFLLAAAIGVIYVWIKR